MRIKDYVSGVTLANQWKENTVLLSRDLIYENIRAEIHRSGIEMQSMIYLYSHLQDQFRNLCTMSILSYSGGLVINEFDNSDRKAIVLEENGFIMVAEDDPAVRYFKEHYQGFIEEVNA